MNNDGHDDLIVGAPHYNDKSGKVYIYLGSEDVLKFFKQSWVIFFVFKTFIDFQEFLENNPVIESSIKGAQFGYSLSCGDLDHDGFSGIWTFY